MGKIVIKPVRVFEELTNKEVYDFARVRADVFIFEQKVLDEEDLDGKDLDAYHVLAYKDDKIAGCLRLLVNENNQEVWVGRVVVAKDCRRMGIAYKLLLAALEFIKDNLELSKRKILLSAQCYAVGLYEKAGFKTVGEPYDEVGIQHIHMEYKK